MITNQERAEALAEKLFRPLEDEGGLDEETLIANNIPVILEVLDKISAEVGDLRELIKYSTASMRRSVEGIKSEHNFPE